MSGKTSIRRLDFGVGQGDWKATTRCGNEVGVSFCAAPHERGTLILARQRPPPSA